MREFIAFQKKLKSGFIVRDPFHIILTITARSKLRLKIFEKDLCRLSKDIQRIFSKKVKVCQSH
jgi:hypothetical protein